MAAQIDKTRFLFSKTKGSVCSIVDPTMPGTVTFGLQSWQGYRGFRAIITAVSISAQGNYQFLNSLGGNIYVYVFGDKMGEAVLSGLAFDHPCPDKYGQAVTGIENVMAYYLENRLANRQTPLTITIGARRAIVGYLVGFYAKSADLKEPGIYEFSLSFMLPPPNMRLCRTTAGSNVAAAGAAGAASTAAVASAPQPDSSAEGHYALVGGYGGSAGGATFAGMPPPAIAVPGSSTVDTSGNWAADYMDVPASVAGLPIPYFPDVG